MPKAALVDHISLYVGLVCAEQQKTPSRKALIEMISSCLGGGLAPSPLRDFGALYRKLYPGSATNITVKTGNSSLKNCRAMYTAYNNLNVWFDTLKEFLITKGFARKRLDGEMMVKGTWCSFLVN